MGWKFYDSTGSLITGIAAGSITNAKMAANSIDSDQYVDGSIDNAHIADNAIDSEHYADGSVDYAHIQDVAANSILVRDANSSGVLTAKALATTNIIIGDGTGFTVASLSGQATMDNAGAVTVGTLNQNTTGSAATLTTTRAIGGVNFNGSAAIDLPGVNAVGDQNTSGTAAGLSGSVLTGDVTSSGNAATLVLSNLTGAAINVAADSIPFLDSDGSATRIESIADLATAMAGANLTASSGTLVAGAAGVGIRMVIALS
jgi:hypothetical protein